MILDQSLPGDSDSLPSAASGSSVLRILVVEDGKNAADILAMFFELEGHQVGVAYDGVQAVSLAESLKPHLILMDIGMPKMNGLEAARQIRARAGDRPPVIVALSGLDQDEDKRQCSEAGIDAHLAKPVAPDELRALIERYRGRFAELV
jgi:CheY-like chemotaxis protein